ncbi:hypothetical protein LTR84_010154 [Exophiala bonariae]|uniref:Sodium/calcium exchanger membrane region domain-containing protein n=1 Tax=Exophiala bonariae TaxID=1690606 RepID=A0AAV9MTM8_9EURO|nr:hypothetical protein LTR84_010154 [Exophiala bonariae]
MDRGCYNCATTAEAKDMSAESALHPLSLRLLRATNVVKPVTWHASVLKLLVLLLDPAQVLVGAQAAAVAVAMAASLESAIAAAALVTLRGIAPKEVVRAATAGVVADSAVAVVVVAKLAILAAGSAICHVIAPKVVLRNATIAANKATCRVIVHLSPAKSASVTSASNQDICSPLAPTK